MEEAPRLHRPGKKWVYRVGKEEMETKHVFGTLPLFLAADVKSVTYIPASVPRALGGADLDAATFGESAKDPLACQADSPPAPSEPEAGPDHPPPAAEVDITPLLYLGG